MTKVLSFPKSNKAIEAEQSANQIIDALNAVSSSFKKAQGIQEIRASHDHIVEWIQGDTKNLPIQSSIKMDFAYLALFDARLIEIHYQPISFRVTNTDFTKFIYTPDFLLRYKNNQGRESQALIDITSDSHDNIHSTHLKKLSEWGLENNIPLHWINRNKITDTYVDTIKILYPFRFEHSISLIETSIFFNEIKQLCPISTNDLLKKYATTPEERIKIKTQISILIARQYLYIDLSKSWNENTHLHRIPVWTLEDFLLF